MRDDESPNLNVIPRSETVKIEEVDDAAANDALTEKFRTALREPQLTLRLDRVFGGPAPLIHLEKPGTTSKCRPVTLTPVIVGSPGQKHSDMLRQLADALEQVGR